MSQALKALPVSVFLFNSTKICHQTEEEVTKIPPRSHYSLEQPSTRHSLICSDNSAVTVRILLCALRTKCVTRRHGSSVHLHKYFSSGTNRPFSDIFSVGSLHENSSRKHWSGSYRPCADWHNCTTVLFAFIYKTFLFSCKAEVVKEFSKVFHINF
jgi:hypothetical protein